MTFTDILLKLRRRPKKSILAALDLTLPPAHTTHVHVSPANYTQLFGSIPLSPAGQAYKEHKYALENALFFGSKAYSSSVQVHPAYNTTKIEWLEDTFMPNTFSKLLAEEKTIEANDRNNGTWQPNTPA